jgi:hypothetical protein
MYFFYMYRREEFLAHYHRRSNVETTFAMSQSFYELGVEAEFWKAS